MKTLLEILNTPEKKLFEINKYQSIKQSILQHLNDLFNTRQGSLQHMPDYGIPEVDYVYVDMPHSINSFIQSLRRTIEKYETRLTAVSVVQQNKNTKDYLVVKIMGQLIGNELINFEVVFDCSSSAKISLIKENE